MDTVPGGGSALYEEGEEAPTPSACCLEVEVVVEAEVEAEVGSELRLQESGLWSGEVRECVGVHRLSDHDINTARKTGDLNKLSATSFP